MRQGSHRFQTVLDCLDRPERVRDAGLDERHPYPPIVAEQRQGGVLDNVEQEPVVVKDVSEVLANGRARDQERVERELGRRRDRGREHGADMAEQGERRVDEGGWTIERIVEPSQARRSKLLTLLAS